MHEPPDDDGVTPSAAPLRQRVGDAGRYLGKALRLMVGVPDYDGYVAHMRRLHPGQPVMSPAAFLRNRQEARYGGVGRCC